MAQRERTTGGEGPDTSAPVSPHGSVPPADGTEGSKARRVTFRVVAVLVSLWILASSIFGLTEIVFMWLPDETLSSVDEALDLGGLDLAHRAHFMSIGIVHWALVLGVVVQLRRPARREAPMLQLLAIAIGLSVTVALSGNFRVWLIHMLAIVSPLLLLGFLHPRARRLVRMPTWDRGMVALAAVGAAPWLVFAFTNAQLQWRNVAGDTHAEMDHWRTVALMALIIVACAFIGSTDRSGWPLTAWIAAVAGINYGLHSLVFPQPASAASTPWAIAALAWGVAYAIAIIRRSRTGSSAPAD